MKKLFFAAAILMLFFTGCVGDKTIIIDNKSSQTITCWLNTGHRTAVYVVEPGEQYVYMLVRTLDHQMIAAVSYPLPDSVFFVQSGDTYTFYDNPAPPKHEFPVNIYNSLSKIVILSGDGAMSTDPITINPGEEITTETITLLSGTGPIFSAETIEGYPVQVSYNFDEDKKEYKIILR